MSPVLIDSWAIPLAAFIVSAAALILTVLTSRTSVTSAYAQQLERRVEHLERELEHALALVASTREENIDLLRRLFQATGGRRDVPP